MILTRQFFSDPSYRCCRLAKKERCEEGAAFGMGRGASRETFTPVQRVSFFIIICVCFNVQTTYVYLFSNFLIFKPSLSHFFLSCLVIYCALSVFFPSVAVFVGNLVPLPLSYKLSVFLSVFFFVSLFPIFLARNYTFSLFFYCSCFLSLSFFVLFSIVLAFFLISFLPPFSIALAFFLYPFFLLFSIVLSFFLYPFFLLFSIVSLVLAYFSSHLFCK